MHQLKVHEIGLKVGHGIGQLAELRLECIEREGRIVACSRGLSEGGAGRGSQGRGWTGDPAS